jgi:hypothetical protein
MTIEATLVAQATSAASPSPWANGQLPSPWAHPGVSAGTGSNQTVPSAARTFAEVLDRTNKVAAGSGGDDGMPGLSAARGVAELNMSDRFGVHSIEMLGRRLAKADVDLARSVNNLQNLDPSSPELGAELLSVNLLSVKSGVMSTISMKFASKVNESLNTLLKTN